MSSQKVRLTTFYGEDNMQKYLILALLLFATVVFAEPEIYMANQAGGILTLTHQECTIAKYKEHFPWHGYGTQANGTVHVGCYQIPDAPTEEELKDIPPNVHIVPIINFIDAEDGQVFALRADWFTSDKPGESF